MKVQLTTSEGPIVIALDAEKAPKTAANFVEYVKSGFYDGTIFHRVIQGFMIQGGGFDTDMDQKKSNAPVENEADNGLLNNKGTIAMARTMDPHSASSQFFINCSNNDFLNFKSQSRDGWGYCVFGEVTEGMEVVTGIEGKPTGSKAGHSDVPVEHIIIESAVVLDE